MRSLIGIVLCVLVLTSTFPDPAHGGGTPSVANLPPVVVKTVPASGDTRVDPGLGEIRITFSKDMLTNKMWSLVQISKETFPATSGQPHFLADKRTIVVPVKLQAKKTYALWINKGKFNSFRDTGQRPAIPYLLVFETGS